MLKIVPSSLHSQHHKISPFFLSSDSLSNFYSFKLPSLQADLLSMMPENSLRDIRGLVHLTLRLKTRYHHHPSQLEIPLARATPYLTHLDLSGNGFDSIPTAIMGLERLQHLDISQNPLQIRQACLDSVMSLPKLCILVMRKEDDEQPYPFQPWLHPWDTDSLNSIASIRSMLPRLNVQL